MKNGYTTVGTVIKTLSKFPEDAEIEFNDKGVVIGHDNFAELENAVEAVKNSGIKIKETYVDECAYEDEGCITDECDDEMTYEDIVMDGHLYGIANCSHEFLEAIRAAKGEDLLTAPILMPNKGELDFEARNLNPNQSYMLDEIRKHNAYVAECMAEMHRREIAAFLEYNTQMLAQFGYETNRVMCEVVNRPM